MASTEKEKLVRLYDEQAQQYDMLRRKKKHIDHNWRRELLSSAKGKILEVSVGAGANFKFYPKDAEVTAADISVAMIERAKGASIEAGVKTHFIVSAVEDIDLSAESYDTIVSTLSLCAYDDPVKVLQLFNRWCKRDGQILLLEHGVSKYGLVHWVQNRMDSFQYRRIGCHANRDILGILKQSALEIKKVERKLMGVMYLVWAKPA